jgi:adenylosuccinate lyase
MALTDLLAITPIDGRYKEDVKELVPYSSEKGLIKNRLYVEVEYLLGLGEIGIASFSNEETSLLRGLYENLTDEDAQVIKDIEVKDVEGINKGKKTDHDMKAVELFMRHKLKGTSLENRLELIHVCLTSEDVNNIAYSIMLKDAVEKCVIPALIKLEDKLVSMADKYKDMPMPGRTHGQHAIPTTVGKELAVFAYRVALQLDDLMNMELKGKLNGAIGNYSAFYAAYPDIKWEEFSEAFVLGLGLDHNPITTPQKINPIKFENSEANLGAANALLGYFAAKLPISRFQRVLSDSATQRWIGTALAASVLAYKNTLRGLNKSEPNKEALDLDLGNHWEMLAEPIQQILRREGVSGAYDLLKNATQGKQWGPKAIIDFCNAAKFPDTLYAEIMSLTPQKYVGKAPELTAEAIQKTNEILSTAKARYLLEVKK